VLTWVIVIAVASAFLALASSKPGGFQSNAPLYWLGLGAVAIFFLVIGHLVH
jgi:hypothetical protein